MRLLTELVRTRTVGAGEGELARACGRRLERAGLATRLVDLDPGREQLVATLGGEQAPLTLTGHLDTVPATATDWSADPWAADCAGDRIVGRGTSDMKAGVAAAVVAVEAHATRPHACRGIQVVLTAGEETGCTGALRIPPGLLRQGGPLLVAEPTQNRLVPAHKGALWLRMSSTGVAAHGSAPELGVNAVVRLARAAVAIHDHTTWPTQEGFGPVTANVGMLRGGVQPNVVPDAAEMWVDVRTVPAVDVGEVRDLVGSVAGPDVRVEDDVALPAVSTPVDDPFVGQVAESLTAVGLPAEPAPPARYFTDASALVSLLTRSRGSTVPAVVLGPGEPDQCHVADEWCSLTRVEQAVALYEDLLDRWCAVG